MTTRLQKISRSVNWFIGCRLQKTKSNIEIRSISSANTDYLIYKRNELTKELIESIKKDYAIFKHNEEKARAAEVRYLKAINEWLER